VKLRDFAVALIDYLGHAPAEQPARGKQIQPDPSARRAAELTGKHSHSPARMDPSRTRGPDRRASRSDALPADCLTGRARATHDERRAHARLPG